MVRFVWLLAVIPLTALAQPAPVAPTWPLDEITLTNGAKFSGLILNETATEVRFQSVRRSPGKPTVTLTSTFAKVELAGIRRLSAADRDLLKKRIAELDPDGSGERQRINSLELVEVPWLGGPAKARRYDSEHFALVSDAPEEVARRAAIRLEQLYTAFARFLPPTVTEVRPTVVYLAQDLEGYKALLAPLGLTDLLNPAVYDPRANQIVCGSDLRRLGKELDDAKFHHAQQIAALDRYEEGVRKLYKKPELDRHLVGIAMDRARVYRTDRTNGKTFDDHTARLFAVLSHESFHAYAATFVYPARSAEQIRSGAGTGDLPRWLNEGLAQVFETAVVEAGELRADHADLARLNRAKDLLRKPETGGLLSLADLLATGKEAFLAHHADQRAAADRTYLTGWSLAHYLTFDRRLIGTAAFHRYLIAVNTGTDPRSAFAALVGQDLPVFEAAWHSYVRRLRQDGTLGK